MRELEKGDEGLLWRLRPGPTPRLPHRTLTQGRPHYTLFSSPGDSRTGGTSGEKKGVGVRRKSPEVSGSPPVSASAFLRRRGTFSGGDWSS